MPDTNIKFEVNVSEISILSIRADVKNKLEEKIAEYDKLIRDFTDSECMHASAIRNMLANEKVMVNNLIEFYNQLLNMLENAGDCIEKTEDAFSMTHLEK